MPSTAVRRTPRQVLPHVTTPRGDADDCRIVDADAALVCSFRAGDSAAFDVLVKRHEKRLLKVAIKITRNREDAEDAVQDSFLRAFTRADSFRGDSRFLSWLTRITINQALMTMRGKTRKTSSLDERRVSEEGETAWEPKAGGYTPEELCSQREFEQLLFACAAGMNKALRQAWWLRTIEDIGDREIAQALGITLTAAKTRLFRARRELRHRMERRMAAAHAFRTAAT